MHSHLALLLLLYQLLANIQTFEFIPPTISANPLTIASFSTYIISANRQFDATLTSTAWNSQLVPAGSNISVIFPSAYDLSLNSPSCQLVIVNGAVITDPLTCTVNANQFIIEGAVQSLIAISQVSIFLNNVMNPSPALTTGTFIVKIGNDNSQNISGQATVTLQPGALLNATVTFDPATVNTTGSMIVTLLPNNQVPASGGSIRIKFAASLQWTKDLSTNNQLPISGNLPCFGLSTNINNTTISCTGVTSSQQITITNLLFLNTNAQISISITGLFSPPTTQSIDILRIRTFNGAYVIDQKNATISNLQPKTLSVAISSTSAVMAVNSNGGLRFDFTLSDTISKDDHFQIEFPLGTRISYITAISSFLLAGNSTYNSSTRTLTVHQSASSPLNFAGRTSFVTFLSFTAPFSIRPTNPIILRIKNEDYLKMQGQNTVSAIFKNYTLSGRTTFDTVSAETTYTLIIPLVDPLTSTGMLIIKVPSQLKLSTNCPVFVPSSSIKANPSCSISGQQITVTSIASGSTFPVQNITLNIVSVINPPSSVKINDWLVQIYYTADTADLVAKATMAGIIIQPGILDHNQISVDPSSDITYDNSVSYEFEIAANHSITANGFVQIEFPNETVLTQPSSCSFQYLSAVLTSTCIYIPPSKIQITILSQIPSSASFKVSVNSGVKNPATTKPSTTFKFITMNNLKEIIDRVSNDVYVQVTTPRPFINISTVPASLKNHEVTFYTFSFTQEAAYTNQSVIRIKFPSQISFQSNSSCQDSFGGTLICTKNTSNNSVQVTLPFPNTTAQISVRINGVINAQSFKPSSTFLFYTLTNQSYFYCDSTNNNPVTITNNIYSPFTSVSYNFGAKQFGSNASNLTLSIQMKSQLEIGGKISIDLDWMKINAPGVQCQSVDFPPICNTTNVSVIQISSPAIIPALFSITIKILTNPSQIPSRNLTLQSYDPSNFLIHQQSTIRFQLECELPCQTCPGTNTSKCLSCYSQSSNITTFVYLFDSQCLQECPKGTFNQNFACLPCDLNCQQCSILATNCTLCSNNSYLLTNTGADTKSCVASCPNGLFPDDKLTVPACTLCTNPCVNCLSAALCLSCVQPLYLVQISNSCTAICPLDISVPNDGNPIKKCLNCSTECKTCQNTINFCTSCNSPLLLHLNKCINSCPTGFVPNTPLNSTQCVVCLSPCNQCSITQTNCTRCLIEFPFLHLETCLEKCPQLTFNNTLTSCKLCSSVTPAINCQNCSSSTQCLTCDTGFVFFPANKSCIVTVPIGYVNISGIAQPCQGDCATCEVTTSNCTSCKTLFLQANTCISPCPTGKVGISNICQDCSPPCASCSISRINCITCVANFYLKSTDNTCVIQCPSQTFASISSKKCESCIAPCFNCTSSSACINCQTGFISGVKCLQTCPDGQVGTGSNNDYLARCQNCQTPCTKCTGVVNNCTECVNPLFFYDVNQTCINQCPAQITIPNIVQRTCSGCISPCATCVISVDNCLTCVFGKLKNGNSCIDRCPDGKFAYNQTCVQCQTVNTCQTCSSETICTSCSNPFFFYNGTCILACPPAFNVLINNSCTACLTNCINCSNTDQCYNCTLDHILFNNTCITQCPIDYTLTLNQTIRQYYCNFTGQSLTGPLSLVSVFPLPFTIIGVVIFIACFMSKLQNQNTYIIGLAYCIFGFFEVASIVFLGYQYWALLFNTESYDESILIMIIAGLALIYFLNLIGICLQTPLLLWDFYFRKWLHAKNLVANQSGSQSDLKDSLSSENRNTHEAKANGNKPQENGNKPQEDCCGHRLAFGIITLISLLLSYKFKMILFTKLFAFECFSARLQNVQQFRLFNLLSFLGILHEGQILYVSFVLTAKFSYEANPTIFMAAVDVIIIALLNILLALITSHKNDDFFQTKDTFNEEKSKQKKHQKEQMNGKTRYTPMDSTSKLNANNPHDDQQISLELSKGDQDLPIESIRKAPRKNGSNIFDRDQEQGNEDFGTNNKLNKNSHNYRSNYNNSQENSYFVSKSPINKIKKRTLSPKTNLSPNSPRKVNPGIQKKSKMRGLQDLDIQQIKQSSLKTSKLKKQKFNIQSDINQFDVSEKTSPRKKQWVQINGQQKNIANQAATSDVRRLKLNNFDGKTVKNASYIQKLKQQQEARSNIDVSRKFYSKKSSEYILNEEQQKQYLQKFKKVSQGSQGPQHFEQLPVQLRDFQQQPQNIQQSLTNLKVKRQPAKLIQVQNLQQEPKIMNLSEISIQKGENQYNMQKPIQKQTNFAQNNLQVNKESQNQLNQARLASNNINHIDQSFQSILPFVHQNGELVDKVKQNKEIKLKNKQTPQKANISIQFDAQEPLKQQQNNKYIFQKKAINDNFFNQTSNHQQQLQQNINGKSPKIMEQVSNQQILQNKIENNPNNDLKQQEDEFYQSKFSKKLQLKAPKVYNSGLRIGKIQNQDTIGQNIDRKISQKQQMLKRLQDQVRSKQQQAVKSVKRQRSRQLLRKSKQKLGLFDPLQRKSNQKSKQIGKITNLQRYQQSSNSEQQNRFIRKGIKIQGNIFSQSEEQSHQKSIVQKQQSQQQQDANYQQLGYAAPIKTSLKQQINKEQQNSNEISESVDAVQHSNQSFQQQDYEQSPQQKEQQQQNKQDNSDQQQSQTEQEQNSQNSLEQQSQQQQQQQSNDQEQVGGSVQRTSQAGSDLEQQIPSNLPSQTQSNFNNIPSSNTYNYQQQSSILRSKKANFVIQQQQQISPPFYNFSKQKFQEIQSLSHPSLSLESQQIYQRKQPLLMNQRQILIDRNQQQYIKRQNEAMTFQFPKESQQDYQQGMDELHKRGSSQFQKLTTQQQSSILQLLKRNQGKNIQSTLAQRSRINISPIKNNRKQLPKQQNDDFGISRIRTKQQDSGISQKIPPLRAFKKSNALGGFNSFEANMWEDSQLQRRNTAAYHPIQSGKINRQFIQASNSQASFPDLGQNSTVRKQTNRNRNLDQQQKQLKHRVLDELQKRQISSRDAIPRHRRAKDPFSSNNISQQLPNKILQIQGKQNWGRHFGQQENKSSQKRHEQDDAPSQPVLINQDGYFPQLHAVHELNEPVRKRRSNSKNNKSRSNSRGRKKDQSLQKIYLQKLQLKRK